MLKLVEGMCDYSCIVQSNEGKRHCEFKLFNQCCLSNVLSMRADLRFEEAAYVSVELRVCIKWKLCDVKNLTP